MATFTATTRNREVVAADRTTIWKVLTDPVLLPRLTPYLDSIRVDGDHWRWEMTKLPVLGVSIAPSFTERMTFDDGRRIAYTHDPPDGGRERAGAEGEYHLRDAEGGTELSIELSLCVDLPLPRASTPAVRRVMEGVMDRMGTKFAANLIDHVSR